VTAGDEAAVGVAVMEAVVMEADEVVVDMVAVVTVVVTTVTAMVEDVIAIIVAEVVMTDEVVETKEGTTKTKEMATTAMEAKEVTVTLVVTATTRAREAGATARARDTSRTKAGGSKAGDSRAGDSNSRAGTNSKDTGGSRARQLQQALPVPPPKLAQQLLQHKKTQPLLLVLQRQDRLLRGQAGVHRPGPMEPASRVMHSSGRRGTSSTLHNNSRATPRPGNSTTHSRVITSSRLPGHPAQQPATPRQQRPLLTQAHQNKHTHNFNTCHIHLVHLYDPPM